MNKKTIVLGAAVLFGFAPLFARAAQIYLDPAAGKYPPGVTFGVDVRIDTTASQCVNAAEVDIAYPKDQIQAVAASDGDSIFSVWVKKPTIYADYGLVSFVGGLPGGYCGRIAGDPSLSNKLATIYFRFPTSTAQNSSTQPQPVRLTVLSGTKAILNDGEGTVAPLTTSGAAYTQILTGKYAPLDTWQSAITNDTTKPEPFTVGVYRDPSLFEDQWFATFSTVDKQTGIDHYEVAEVPPSKLVLSENQWDWKRAISPYLIQDQSLTSVIAVRAIDAAGNARVEEYVPANAPKVNPKNIQVLPFLAIIGVVGFVILQLFLRLF